MSPVRTGLLAIFATCAFIPAAATAEPEVEVAASPLMTVDEPELRSFAEVWRQVADIRQRYGSRMQGASADEREALRTEANREIRAVVERSALAPQRYNQLAATAAADPALKERLAAHLQQVSTSPQEQ